MKNILIILSIALLPTLVQAEKALDKQVEAVTVSESESAKKEQDSQDLLQTMDSNKESSVSQAKTDTSKQAK